MITDDELYRLAIFLGAVSMILIVIYHFFEVNANKKGIDAKATGKAPTAQPHTGNKNVAATR